MRVENSDAHNGYDSPNAGTVGSLPDGKPIITTRITLQRRSRLRNVTPDLRLQLLNWNVNLLVVFTCRFTLDGTYALTPRALLRPAIGPACGKTSTQFYDDKFPSLQKTGSTGALNVELESFSS